MALPSLSVVIGAQIQGFEKAMGDVSKRINAVDREAQKAFSGFEKLGDRIATATNAAGVALTAGLTAPLAAITTGAVNAARGFETSFNRIEALGDNIVGPALERLKAQALDLGAKTAFSAQQAADGMEVFASAGHSAEQILAEMPGTLALAAAGTIAIGDAAEITKNTLGQFQLAAGDAGKVADVLAQISKDTSAKMLDLGNTLNYVGPVAKGAGQSLEETGAAIIALDKAGIQGEKAGTGLRGVIASLIAPSNEASKYINQLGVNVSDSSGKIRPLSDIMEQFKQKLAGVGSEAERQNFIFQIFGREAGNAAQVLINTGGPALDEFKQKLLNSGGAATEMASTMNRGLNYAIDQFKGSIETAGIALGQTLLPTIQRILDAGTKLVNDFALPAAQAFAKMPEPLQNAAIATAALTAATGPVLLIIGQLAGSVTPLLAAFTSLTGAFVGTGVAAGPLPGVMASITAAAPVAAVAVAGLAAAWAAWKFQDDLPGIILLKAELNTLKEVVLFQAEAFKFGATAIMDKLKPAYESLATVLDVLLWPHRQLFELLQLIARGAGGVSDSIKEMRQWLAGGEKPTDDFAKALGKLNERTGELAPGLLKSAGGLDAFGRPLQKTTTDTFDFSAALGQMNKAMEDATRKTHEAVAVNGVLARAMEILQSKYDAAKASVNDYKARLLLGKVETVDLAKESLALAGAIGQVEQSVGKLSDSTLPDYIAKMSEAAGPVVELEKALGTLGIKGAAELKRIADEAAKARDAVMGSGVGSDFEKKTAIYKALEAQIEYAKVAGIEITEEQKRTMEALSRELGVGHTDQKNKWKNFTQQVSTIVNDLARDLAASTINLFKGLFGFDGFNADLQKQSETLRGELATRAGDFETYRQSIETQIEQLTAKHNEQMEEEIAALRNSLAERTAEYEQYAQNVATELENLRNTEGEKLAAEQGRLADALRDREAAYQEYQQEVAAREQEIRQSHADRLAEQLADLRNNLADKQQAYDDYVLDANTKLSRIGIELSDDIGDITLSINRRIEDENTDFARDTEKLNSDLRKAEKSGNKERAAEIRRELQQREEDHARTIQRLKEDLAEQVDDARRRAEQQTADTKIELDRRARDHAEYVAENIEQQEEATRKNRESLESQLGDLHDNLDKRTKELLKFREETALAIEAAATQSAQKIKNAETEAAAILKQKKADLDVFATAVNGKIDAVTLNYKTKVAEETAALKTGFANKLKEYDAYKLSVETKLTELENAHKGPLDRIKEMFGSVATSAANAFLRLASEELWGNIIDGIKERLKSTALGAAFNTFIQSIADKLADVFGTAGGAVAKTAGNTAGGVGGVGSSAAGAASGLLGTLTAVGALGSFAAGVVTAIGTLRLEGTMNAVEENTRFAAIGMIGKDGLVDTARTYLPELLNIRTLEVQFLEQHAWRIHDVWERLGKIHETISNETNGYLRRMADAVAPMTPAMPVAAYATDFGASIVIHNHLYLDGKEISNAITTADEFGGGAL